jgi:hypothetical protein
MKRLPLAAVAALAIAVALAAPAASENTHAHHSPPDPCAHHRHPGAEQRALAQQVFAYSHWQRPAPGPGAVATMRRLRGCAPARRRDEMAAGWKAAAGDLKLQHRYREVATFPGFVGEGRFLRWLVIPSWVVEDETSECSRYGDTPQAGECRWTIANPESGACGPYQLLDHTSCDTSTPQDKLRHHEVAASLPRGSWAVGY